MYICTCGREEKRGCVWVCLHDCVRIKEREGGVGVRVCVCVLMNEYNVKET